MGLLEWFRRRKKRKPREELGKEKSGEVTRISEKSNKKRAKKKKKE